MSTRDTIKSYYNSLKQKEGWESFLADEMTFINNGKQLKGKDAALEGFGRFFSMVQSLEVKELLIEDEKASAVIRYALQSPNGKTFSSDVAEFITLKNGKFVSFAIYFDTAVLATWDVRSGNQRQGPVCSSISLTGTKRSISTKGMFRTAKPTLNKQASRSLSVGKRKGSHLCSSKEN